MTARYEDDVRVWVPGDPKIVAIGGGHGLSNTLRALRPYTKNVTAIVTVADDGGGSGMLREELGMLPPGDIRSCILALSNTEPTMEALLDYRFTAGSLKGQSFGNLFLAALNGMYGSFDEAVRRMGEVLNITGRVLRIRRANQLKQVMKKHRECCRKRQFPMLYVFQSINQNPSSES